MNFKVFFFLFLIMSMSSTAWSSDYDSLRTEVRNGKKVVIHLVEQGETLYSLAKRYNTTVDEIISYNTEASKTIRVGDQIAIPYRTIHQTTIEASKAPDNESVHIVDIGESVYSISKKYDISIKELQKMNQLSSFDIKVGQRLRLKPKGQEANTSKTTGKQNNADKTIKQASDVQRKFHIVAKKETLFSLSKQYQIAIDSLKSYNNLTSNNLSLGQKLFLDNPSLLGTIPKNSKIDTLTEKETPPAPSLHFKNLDEEKERIVEIGGIKKKFEKGFGAVITSGLDTNKYLALHKSAPLGTIIQIRNLMTKKTVTARVIGKLPPTGNNTDILIRLSKITYERLGGLDRNIPVEVSYIP